MELSMSIIDLLLIFICINCRIFVKYNEYKTEKINKEKMIYSILSSCIYFPLLFIGIEIVSQFI